MEIDFSAEGSHYSLLGGNLVISNPVKEQHVGRYRCLAANTLGTVISREASVQFGCRWHTCDAPVRRAELTELLWSPASCMQCRFHDLAATATAARVECFSNRGHMTEHMAATGMEP